MEISSTGNARPILDKDGRPGIEPVNRPARSVGVWLAMAILGATPLFDRCALLYNSDTQE